jgi:hypothetical protein
VCRDIIIIRVYYNSSWKRLYILETQLDARKLESEVFLTVAFGFDIRQMLFLKQEFLFWRNPSYIRFYTKEPNRFRIFTRIAEKVVTGILNISDSDRLLMCWKCALSSSEISILLEGEYPNYSPEHMPRSGSIAALMMSVVTTYALLFVLNAERYMYVSREWKQ